jgi:hypothetical protein
VNPKIATFQPKHVGAPTLDDKEREQSDSLV